MNEVCRPPIDAMERLNILCYDGNSYVFDLNQVKCITIEGFASQYEIISPPVADTMNKTKMFTIIPR